MEMASVLSNSREEAIATVLAFGSICHVLPLETTNFSFC